MSFNVSSTFGGDANATTSTSGVSYSETALLGFACLIVLYAVSTLKWLSQASMAKIPGPAILDWTMMPALYKYVRGEQWSYIDDMHAKYGSIFRMGSKQVYISDKHAIRQLIVKENLPKVGWYAYLSRDPKTPGLFTSVQKDYHRQRRRLLSPAFSVAYLKNLEPFLTNATSRLMRSYGKQVEAAGPTGEITVNIYDDLASLAMDILGETAFGTNFNLVDIPGEEGDKRFKNINKLLAQYMHDGGIRWFVRPFDSYVKRSLEVYKLMGPLVDARHQQEESERADILQFLVDASKNKIKGQESELSLSQVKDQVVELLIAGGETTSNSTTYILMALLDHPEILAQLIDSIPEQSVDAPIPTEDDLRDTPFLDACIEEGLRMFPVTAELGRRTLKDPFVTMGYVIPPKTAVSASLRALHYNPEYWPEPNRYWPERFLKGSNAPQADREAFLPFSAGARNCIGLKLAWLELKMVIYCILSRFTVEKVPDQKVEFCQFVTFQMRNPQYYIKLTPRVKA